jgi:hypothetical protein
VSGPQEDETAHSPFEQVVPGGHTSHWVAPNPQAEGLVPETQASPRQQPPQVPGSQTEGPQTPGGWQISPWQSTQACPETPQAWLFRPMTQTAPAVVLSQHPLLHVVALHVVIGT